MASEDVQDDRIKSLQDDVRRLCKKIDTIQAVAQENKRRISNIYHTVSAILILYSVGMTFIKVFP